MPDNPDWLTPGRAAELGSREYWKQRALAAERLLAKAQDQVLQDGWQEGWKNGRWRMSFGHRVAMYKRWWTERRVQRGPIWVAVAPTPEAASPLFPAPRADKVYHEWSAVFVKGKRHYAFLSEEERDAFVRAWPEAQACEDPI